MKVNKLSKILIILISLLTTNIHASAESKKLIYEDSRQGSSWSVYLLDKKLIKEIELGGETRRLYLVNEEINSSYDGIRQQTNLVQCSTSQPFIAFKDEYEQQMAIIHYINPGGEMFGYNTGDHWTYWAVCHDLFSPREYDLKLRANELGYSTKLESQQLEIPYELLQYLK
jgi:hypothetical protein